MKSNSALKDHILPIKLILLFFPLTVPTVLDPQKVLSLLLKIHH